MPVVRQLLRRKASTAKWKTLVIIRRVVVFYLHAGAVIVVDVPYLPAPHFVHVVALPMEYVPTGQGSGAILPCRHTYPAGHGVGPPF
jgi:hypothetical protein